MWGNGGYDKRFLHTNNMEKQLLTLYIDSNVKLPYIYLMRKTKVVVLP